MTELPPAAEPSSSPDDDSPPIASSAIRSLSEKSSGMLSGLRLVSLCTLLSRTLGMIRDMGMAALFGNGVVMDAFSVAFRIPNLARRLFGEGALTAAFLPSFIRYRERTGIASAWQLGSALLLSLLVLLSVLVVIGELLLGGCWLLSAEHPETRLLIELTAILLPYLVLICAAAQMSAMLHALGHFAWPALLPVLLNLIWIGSLVAISFLTDSPVEQIHWISACVVLAGFVQLFAQLPTLRRKGFRLEPNWEETRKPLREIFVNMMPILIGLSITQLNTLLDSLLAWGFSAPEAGGKLWGNLDFPLETGTAAALYFGQRMYQFPLGVFGVALGTVMFPRLAQHAETGRTDLLREDLTLGLAMVLCIGIPASAGLALLSDPLTVLLFQHGAFDAIDTRQTSQMIAAYALGVWAYCGLLIVYRAFYAIGDRTTPLKFGLLAIGVNLIMNLTFIWSLGGRALALSSSISAMFQIILIIWAFQKKTGPLDRKRLGLVAGKVILATTVMGVVCMGTLSSLSPDDSTGNRLLRVLLPVISSIVSYLVLMKLLNVREFWLLLKRETESSTSR